MGFRVIRLIDFLTFGLAAIVSAGLAAWAAVTPGNAVIGVVIAALAALGFSFVYAALLGRRLAFARDIAYVTRHGLIVMKSEWTPIRVFVEKETERVVVLWEKAALTESANPKIIRGALQNVVVRWASAPFTLHIRPGFKWMGMTSGSGESMMVGHVEPLERSALGHEIGHVILMDWKMDGTEETLKSYQEKHGTPY